MNTWSRLTHSRRHPRLREMNTPVPGPTHPDPTTPGPGPKPTALAAATTTALAGTPLAVLTVWIIDNWMTAGGKPIVLNVEQAVAIGSVGAAAFGYLTQVAHALFNVLLKKLDAV